MNEALSDRLIAMCIGRGWISPAAGDRARSLVRHGLHVEQAIVGTRLVSRDQYAQVLAEATGLPYAEVSTVSMDDYSDILNESDARDWSVLPLSRKDRTITVGFSHPLPEHLKRVRRHFLSHSLRMEPRVILHASLPRHIASPSVHRLARTVSRLAHTGGAHRITLMSDGLQFDEEPISIRLRPSVASALASFLPRRLGSAWVGDRRHSVLGRMASWFRRHLTGSSHHVLDLSDRVRSLVANPDRFVVVVNADRRLQDWLRKSQVPVMDARTADGSELAMHAALAGSHGIAFTTDRDAWWESLEEAVPITTIIHRAHPVSTWEVSHR
jgi:hypothetical protein